MELPEGCTQLFFGVVVLLLAENRPNRHISGRRLPSCGSRLFQVVRGAPCHTRYVRHGKISGDQLRPIEPCQQFLWHSTSHLPVTCANSAEDSNTLTLNSFWLHATAVVKPTIPHSTMRTLSLSGSVEGTIGRSQYFNWQPLTTSIDSHLNFPDRRVCYPLKAEACNSASSRAELSEDLASDTHNHGA